MNIRQNYTSINIFSTTREPLSISHISDEGVYLQFELPPDALPSFNGLAGIITYLITISLQFPNDTIRSHFPFRVYGHGSHSSYPHHHPFPLCSFAASSRSYDSFMSSLTSSVISLAHTPGTDYFGSRDDSHENDEDNDSPHQPLHGALHESPNKISFSICDLDTICLMTFSGIEMSPNSLPAESSSSPTPGVIGSVESGDTLWIDINFHSSKQFCEMLKFKLIQRECHSDGTRLQVCFPFLSITILSLSR